MQTPNYNHLYGVFESMVLAAQGTNSTWLMEHDVFKGRHGIAGQTWSRAAKDYSFWPRWNQPCQGGEMRKYKEIHGDECTRPESMKPRDLHHPFPEGNPVAVGVAFYGQIKKEHEYIFEHFFSKKSPYRKGLASTRFVRSLTDINGHRPVRGVIIEDTKHVDPTVMVNGLQFAGSVISSAPTIHELITNGATIDEALMLIQLNGVSFLNPGSTFTYYYAEKMGVKKFLDGEPNDLSGGNLFNRTDYNRKDVQDLFMEPDPKKALIWERDVKKKFAKIDNYSWLWIGNFMTDVLPEVLKIIREKYTQDQPVVQTVSEALAVEEIVKPKRGKKVAA